MVSDDFLKRLAEESKATRHGKEIICPYCEKEQSQDAKYSHISYWGDDSKTTIDCEECGKEFWVEEKVERTFETETIEWRKSEDDRFNKLYEESKNEKRV